MKKLGCAKCGGTKKMAKGGSSKVNISKPGAGFAKQQRGGSNTSMGIYGVPNAGMTGPNRNSVTETMQKGGAKKPTKKYVDSKIKPMGPDRPAPKPMMAKTGGAMSTNRPVQSSCKNGMVRDANGKCVMERKMAKGGVAKPKYQDGGKFNQTGGKPLGSLGAKLGVGAGIAGVAGMIGKATVDAIKNRKNRKKEEELKKKYMNKTQDANKATAEELNSMGEYKRGGAKKMQKGGAHPGFKAVQAGIAAKQGVSKKAAGAILASATRKASAKAKKANPRLKRVKG